MGSTASIVTSAAERSRTPSSERPGGKNSKVAAALLQQGQVVGHGNRAQRLENGGSQVSAGIAAHAVGGVVLKALAQHGSSRGVGCCFSTSKRGAHGLNIFVGCQDALGQGGLRGRVSGELAQLLRAPAGRGAARRHAGWLFPRRDAHQQHQPCLAMIGHAMRCASRRPNRHTGAGVTRSPANREFAFTFDDKVELVLVGVDVGGL